MKEEYKVEESHLHENNKILVGLIILIFVLFAHYCPIPFPKNYYLLVVCVLIYFILAFYY